jgi:hypothetical protein
MEKSIIMSMGLDAFSKIHYFLVSLNTGILVLKFLGDIQITNPRIGGQL